MCKPIDNWLLRKLAREAADEESDLTLDELARLYPEHMRLIEQLVPEVVAWILNAEDDTDAETDTESAGGLGSD